MTTKPTDIQIHRFRDAGICVLCVGPGRTKICAERKAKGYAEGMTRGLAVVRDGCIYVIIIRIVFLLSHFFSVIAVHDNSHWWMILRAREIRNAIQAL